MNLRPLLFGALFLVTACSNDADRIDKFYSQLADAYCTYLYRCCDNQELDFYKKQFTTQEGCKQAYAFSTMELNYALQLSADKGYLGAEGSAMDACIAAINNTACGKYTTTTVLEECKPSKLFTGSQEAKKECLSSYDCVTDNYCAGGANTTTGVCVPLRKVDEPCTSAGQCSTGLGCASPKTGVRTCRPLGKTGESCAEIGCDTTSDPDVYCSNLPPTTNPTCAKKKADGESCTSSLECVSAHCDYQGTNGKCSGQAASLCDGK